MRIRSLLILLPLLALLAGCNNPFGKKTDLDYITPPQPSGTDVSYVPVFPFLTGLQSPVAVIAGNDDLLYVVDEGSQEIICYDVAGRVQSRMTVPGVHAIAQDRTLDLLALGAEPLIGGDPSGEQRPLATIYRIDVKKGNYGLGADKIVKRVQQPFYVSGRSINTLDFSVSFNGIAVLPDNRYYVTRSGPGNDPLVRTPNDALLLFDNTDTFITTISITDGAGGSYADFFKQPSAIATVPPRTLTIPNTDPQDFLISTLNPTLDTVLRVRYITVDANDNGVNYSVKQLAFTSGQGVPGALYQAGRFRSPRGLAIANDETGYLFVVDKDSLFQFTSEGVEGVTLRAQSSAGANKVSFGGKGNGPYQFNDPRGVGYLNRIVYVADRGNGRICRYQLSSDFQ